MKYAAVLLAALLASGCATNPSTEELRAFATVAAQTADANGRDIDHCAELTPAQVEQFKARNLELAARASALADVSEDGGPAWLSSVLAWAFSFARGAGLIVAAGTDPPADQALDPGTAAPNELPDNDGDGLPDGACACCGAAVRAVGCGCGCHGD